MVTVIVVLNLLIAATCLYIACRLWQLRSALAIAADILTIAERNTRRVLQNAPQAIIQGQVGTYELRQHYQRLIVQLHQVQQVLALVGLGQVAWQQYHRHRSSHRSTQQIPSSKRRLNTSRNV